MRPTALEAEEPCIAGIRSRGTSSWRDDHLLWERRGKSGGWVAGVRVELERVGVWKGFVDGNRRGRGLEEKGETRDLTGLHWRRRGKTGSRNKHEIKTTDQAKSKGRADITRNGW